MSCVELNHKQPVNQAVKRRREPFHSGLLNVNQGKWIILQPSQRQVWSQSPFYKWQSVYSNEYPCNGLSLNQTFTKY